MTEPRKPSLILPVAASALLLLAGYVGAYYWMVRVGGWRIDEGNYPLYTSETTQEGLAWKRMEQRIVVLFTPIHWIDRRIRPHVWEPTRFQGSDLQMRTRPRGHPCHPPGCLDRSPASRRIG